MAIVRLTSARAVGALVKRLIADKSSGLQAAIHACKAFANGNTYMERQLFVHMCEGLVDLVQPALFIEDFLPVVCALTADPIKNVRISLAGFFATLCARYAEFGADREDVRAMMDKLRQDVDVDVRQALLREEERNSSSGAGQMVDDADGGRHADEAMDLLDDHKLDDGQDGSDPELDDLLNHSAADRDEEAAATAAAAASRVRRLSATEEDAARVIVMQHELLKEGVREDKTENELLRPDEEKQIVRLQQQPAFADREPQLQLHHDTQPHEQRGNNQHPQLHVDPTAPLRVLPALALSNAGRARVGHPAHVATPRGPMQSHAALTRALAQRETDDAAVAEGHDAPPSSAPMEVDSPAQQHGSPAHGDHGGEQPPDQPAVTAAATPSSDSTMATDGEDGSSDSAKSASSSSPAAAVDGEPGRAHKQQLLHQNGVDKHATAVAAAEQDEAEHSIDLT